MFGAGSQPQPPWDWIFEVRVKSVIVTRSAKAPTLVTRSASMARDSSLASDSNLKKPVSLWNLKAADFGAEVNWVAFL